MLIILQIFTIKDILHITREIKKQMFSTGGGHGKHLNPISTWTQILTGRKQDVNKEFQSALMDSRQAGNQNHGQKQRKLNRKSC